MQQDEAARKRFLREAKSAAALDHPYVCNIFEIGEADSKDFISMEYVSGETLKDQLEKGPLPLQDALAKATEIAEALEAAHRQNIIHRDLKPSNIMITPEGHVKVLDFGLAKRLTPVEGGDTQEKTLTASLTQTGAALGTLAYMSPEQSRGEEADARSDVFSCGVVFYEMITGVHPFQKDSPVETASAILNEAPAPLAEHLDGAPVLLQHTVRKMLAKDPDRRYQLIHDVRTDLSEVMDGIEADQRELASGPALVDANRAALPPERPMPFWRQPAALALALVIGLAAAWLLKPAPSLPEPPLRKFAFTPPSPLLISPFNTDVAVSPDGRYIAFKPRGRGLGIQGLDQPQPRLIEGTQGANNPFWSPGSDFIGFVAPPGGLKKVSIHGGSPIRICEMPRPPRNWGASWSPDGEWIVFAAGDPPVLYEVSASGGTPNLLVSPEESEGSPGGPTGGIWRPHFLPSRAGPRVLVFAFGNRTALTMMVQDLETGRREILGPGALPFYSPSGHIVYQADGLTYDLLARPFSLDTLEFTGRSFRIAGRGRDPTVAADGTLVYVDAPAARAWKLVWLNRRGEETEQISQSEDESRYLALSPDGGRLAAAGAAGGSNSGDLWVHDLDRGGRTRLYNDPNFVQYPSAAISSAAWSPSGERVAFTAARDRAGGWGLSILLRRADGSGEPQVLPTPDRARLCDWSRDGKYLFYELLNPDASGDLWYLERKEDGNGWEPHVFLQTPFAELAAQLSPDGEHVAYVSDESGQPEIYVRPFPKREGKTTVSTNGGRQPRWSRDGKELFYAEGSTLVAVSVSTAPKFSVGSATRLFEQRTLAKAPYPQYDVSEDGQRFVFAELAGDFEEPSIQVVQNWFAEFKESQQD